MKLHVVTACVFGLQALSVINGINDFYDRSNRIGNLLGDLYFSVCFVLIVFVGEHTLTVNITVDNHIIVNRGSGFGVDYLFISLIVPDDLADEQIHRNRTRTICNSVRHFGLQTFRKGIVTLACDYRQHIHVVNVVAERVRIHSLAVLIDAQAQTAPHFLTFSNIAGALF